MKISNILPFISPWTALCSNKLRNALAQKSLEKLMQLISLGPHVDNLDCLYDWVKIIGAKWLICTNFRRNHKVEY